MYPATRFLPVQHVTGKLHTHLRASTESLMTLLSTYGKRTLFLAAFASTVLHALPQESDQVALPIEITDVAWSPEAGQVTYRIVNHADQPVTYWGVNFKAIFADGRQSGLVYGQGCAMTDAPDWGCPILPGESSTQFSYRQDREAVVVEVTPFAVFLDDGQALGDPRFIEDVFDYRIHTQFARQHWTDLLREALEEAVDEQDLRSRLQLMYSSLENHSNRYGIRGRLSSTHSGAKIAERALAQQWGWMLEPPVERDRDRSVAAEPIPADLTSRVIATLAELEANLAARARHLPQAAQRLLSDNRMKDRK